MSDDEMVSRKEARKSAFQGQEESREDGERIF